MKQSIMGDTNLQELTIPEGTKQVIMYQSNVTFNFILMDINTFTFDDWPMHSNGMPLTLGSLEDMEKYYREMEVGDLIEFL